jgi:hypothetical protein
MRKSTLSIYEMLVYSREHQCARFGLQSLRRQFQEQGIALQLKSIELVGQMIRQSCQDTTLETLCGEIILHPYL